MARIAKIKLTADAGSFKQDIEKIKTSIRGLGELKVETKGISNIKKALEQDLKEAEEVVRKRIDKIKERIESASKSDILDENRINRNLQILDRYQTKLKKIEETQKELSKQSGAYKFFDALENANPLGKLNRGVGAIAGAAGAIGLGVGVSSLFQRQRGISSERNAISALVGGPVTEEQSQLGFTSEERRQRLLEVARASGRNLSVEEQNRALGLGETAERAYGISAEQQGSFMGASRKAGAATAQDQQKAFAQAIGVANAAGLEGSKIGEFLSSMSEGITQMAQGINVDQDSLQGFAGALSSLPFFASNPERAMRAIQGIASSFSTQTDRFQQAQSSRAIMLSSPGASPSDVEFRRQMDLFGKLPEEALKFYGDPKNGGNADIRKTLSLTGEQIVENFFKDMMANTKDRSPTYRGLQLMNRFNLDAGAADELLRDLSQGKGVSASNMERIRKASMSPDEKLKDTFSGFDSRVTKTGAKIESAMDKMAKDMTGAITNFDSLLGISSDKLANFGTAVTVATATLTALSAASTLGTVGKLATQTKTGTLIGKGAGLMRKGMIGKGAGLMGRGIGRGVGKILPGISMGFAAKDWYDLYDKYQNNGNIGFKDVATPVLSTAAAGASFVPGIGTGAAAGLTALSIGSEFLPESDPATKAMSKTSLPMPQMMSTPDSDNTSATQQNTEAIIRVMEILKQVSNSRFSNSGQSRYPSGADFLPPNTGVGK